MLNISKRAVGVLVAAGLIAGLSACSTSDAAPGAVDPDAKVTIRVGNMPSQDNEANLQLFKEQVEAFQKLNPNITVVGEETKYDSTTFSALVAGGSLPTTMRVPYTNIQQLAANGQVKDITDEVTNDDVFSKMNPDVADQTEVGGKTYGVVTAAYTMALVYNRALYTEAGLDPDAPPTTWDEVAANAKRIQDTTGQAGFSTMTTNNTGGWSLATMSYSMGSMLQDDKDGVATATVDSKGVKSALTFLQDLRWKDDAAGSNFLLNQDDMRNALAAGQIGQTVLAADSYADLAGNRGMPDDEIGIGPLPQSEDGLGTLGGGNISIISPKATPEETAAALKWVKFFFLNKYVDEDAAVAWAKATKESGFPVGAPEVPLFNDEVNDQYLAWQKDYITVDRDNFTAYIASLSELPILPEPRVAAQEVYATLDAVVQRVLTEQGTDVAAALTDAQRAAQDQVEFAQ